MVVNYYIEMDFANPGTPQRIHVKQGDVMSRCIYVMLMENGEKWNANRDVQAVVRYCVQNSDGQVVNHGLYDTLENGDPAYLLVGNTLCITPNRAMTEHPGLVTVDVLLVSGAKQLATFNFELYVERAVNDGNAAQKGNYYRVATLDTINAELNTLRNAIMAMGGGEYLQ